MEKIRFYREISKIKNIPKNKIELEQYTTDIDTAYEFISFVDYTSNIKDKMIADLGCGNGVLGISASLMFAKQVDLYDIDKNAVKTAEDNVKLLKLKGVNVVLMDFFDIEKRYDIAIANPPFGMQSNFNIRAFVKKVKGISESFFFLYKDNKEIRGIAEENGLSIHEINPLKLGKSAFFHKKSNYKLPVVIVYITG